MSGSYPNKNHNFIISDEEISLETRSESYCVCIVDMVDSSRIISRISDPKRIMRYYSIFLNSMAAIARGYGAMIIKNVGDSLIYYFPKTADVTKSSGFKGVIESAITMIWAHKVINAKLSEEKLPLVDYRISADYGRVEIAKSSSSMSEDLFGATINICSKINTKAAPNGLVIGGDLYRVLKLFPDILNAYSFREKGEYSSGLNKSYPLYEMKSKLELIPNLVAPLSSDRSSDMLSANCPNIMIVEDQPDLAFTYNSILTEEGWNVKIFTDSEDALKHYAEIHSCPYDLVILDIRMPKLNGIQLFYRLKSITLDAKIMFLSALDAAEELVSILPGIGHDDIIKKPVRNAELVARIAEKLKRPN
ncbi:MAG: response regulator [Thermoproteota archaeon]|nr:response regulator [Thermoproteota archaeon]